ncbi:putative reverse transcriptase domain-containing protein, partial [Tanacetum coccineum]
MNPVNARNPTVRACYECGSIDHVRLACPIWNRAQGPGENRPNQVAANNGGQGHGNQGNQARGRAFMLGAEEARQDPNIVTDNAAKDKDPKCCPACCRIIRRGNGCTVGKGERGRRHREGNDERVDDLNGQGNDQEMGTNKGVEGVNGNVEGVNGGAPDFSTIIAQQLQKLLPAMLAQVGNQGNVGNQNGNVVNENVQENVGNGIVNGNRVGCSYKEFLACNPKEYDGKEGVIVLTCFNVVELLDPHAKSVAVSMSWNDFKLMMIEEFCPSHEMQKLESELWNHAMVGAGHPAYTDRFHELARLVSTLKVEKRGNVGEPSKDRGGRDDNKRTGNAFATTVNPIGRENMDYSSMSRNVNPVNARNLTVKACYECDSTDHVRSACLRFNRAQGPEENHPNQFAANNGGQGRGNQWNRKAFIVGSRGSSPGSEHYDGFVSTTFIPLLGIEPNDLGFRYEIEIASGQLVEIDKVIKGCKLEIEGHVFDIDLIPFGHRSFDVIIGMDWLSNYKAEIIFHEK